MSITNYDGFDYYPNVNGTSNGLQANWAIHGGVSLSDGRFGGQAVSCSGTISGASRVYQAVTSTANGTLGFAGNLTRFTTGDEPYGFARVGNFDTDICGLGYNDNQQVYLWVGNESTAVATSSLHISVGSWHFYELEITTGSGGINLYVDGLLALAYSGSLGSNQINRVTFGMFNTDVDFETWSYDDFYFRNSATRLGECRIQTLVPNSDAAVTWSRSNGTSNFSQVNSLPAPAQGSQTGDVYSNTVGNADLYGVTSLQGIPTAVFAVKINVCANKDDSGTRTIAPMLSSAGTTVNGVTQALTQTMLYYSTIWEADPHTSNAWTVAAVNSSEIGQKVIA